MTDPIAQVKAALTRIANAETRAETGRDGIIRRWCWPTDTKLVASDALPALEALGEELAELRNGVDWRDKRIDVLNDECERRVVEIHDIAQQRNTAESALAEAKAEAANWEEMWSDQKTFRYGVERELADAKADLEEIVGGWRADAAARDARLAQCQDALREISRHAHSLYSRAGYETSHRIYEIADAALGEAPAPAGDGEAAAASLREYEMVGGSTLAEIKAALALEAASPSWRAGFSAREREATPPPERAGLTAEAIGERIVAAEAEVASWPAYKLEGNTLGLSAAHSGGARAGEDAPRREVLDFASLMEHELRANDHKLGWKDDAAGPLMDRVFEEAHEARDALLSYPRDAPEYRRRLGSELADIANMAMMVADVSGCLPEAATPTAPDRAADALRTLRGPWEKRDSRSNIKRPDGTWIDFSGEEDRDAFLALLAAPAVPDGAVK